MPSRCAVSRDWFLKKTYLNIFFLSRCPSRSPALLLAAVPVQLESEVIKGRHLKRSTALVGHFDARYQVSLLDFGGLDDAAFYCLGSQMVPSLRGLNQVS